MINETNTNNIYVLCKTKTSLLSLKFNSFVHNGKKRYLPIYRDSLRPLMSLSTYECYISQKTSSWSAILSQLNNLNYLFTWAFSSGYDIEKDLLSGSSPEKKQIRAFNSWLKKRKNRKTSKSLKPKTHNCILNEARLIFIYFIEQYGTFPGEANERAINSELVITSLKRTFKKLKKKTRKSYAPDLTEIEIKKIETFLKPKNRIAAHKEKHGSIKPEKLSQIHRNYLIWRLAIEFGLRIGEILALRLEDCPNRSNNFISIVRIEERDSNYVDRRNSPPRPKTLSRELGFLIKNSPTAILINNYITEHRFRKTIHKGKTARMPVLDQPQVLILSHKDDAGNPLSISSAEDIADIIEKETGIPFNWHLARHAFFNRAYSAIADNPNFKDRRKDLIYWGGWESEKSLNIYIRRAIRERAKKALKFWQDGVNEWDALS